MPAGDLITADYQVELRGLLMGDGTDYAMDVEAGAVRGFYDAEGAHAETEYLHAAGSFVGEVREAARTVSVALVVGGPTPEVCATALSRLRAAWAPVGTAAEQLHVRIPGLGKRYVVGWPLGIVADVSYLASMEVPVLCSFRASDPTIRV